MIALANTLPSKLRAAAHAALACAAAIVVSWAMPALAVTVDFEDLPLAPDSAWFGPDPEGEVVEGRYADEVHGQFESRGTSFVNRYTPDLEIWNGFAYSNHTDSTTPGHENQFSAVPGEGHNASPLYGIGSGYHDLAGSPQTPEPFDPANPEHLNGLPHLDIPSGATASSAWVTNTTYAALSMQTGDSFAKRFGGVSGSEPDWFRLNVYGADEQGVPLAATVEFYLADFRSEDSQEDYIVTDWRQVDLTPLSGAVRYYFNLASSDVGQYGMNTPAYFAIDDLALTFESLAGDYNRDGFVDSIDYAVWRESLGESVPTPGDGADGNKDGTVNHDDFDLWLTNYGATPSQLAAATPVPAPGNACLAVALSLTVLLTPRSPFA